MQKSQSTEDKEGQYQRIFNAANNGLNIHDWDSGSESIFAVSIPEGRVFIQEVARHRLCLYLAMPSARHHASFFKGQVIWIKTYLNPLPL